jgi:hypothetical protein
MGIWLFDISSAKGYGSESELLQADGAEQAFREKITYSS